MTSSSDRDSTEARALSSPPDATLGEALRQQRFHAMRLQHVLVVGREGGVRDYDVGYFQGGEVDHRGAAEFRAVGDDDYLTGHLDHLALVADYQGVAVAETSLRDAADSHDQNVGGDAAQHLLAERSDHEAQAGVQIAARQGHFNFARIVEQLGDGQRIRDGLQGTVLERPRDAGHGGTTIQDDRLAVVDETGRDCADAPLLFGHARALPIEIQVVAARLDGHGATVNALEEAFFFDGDQVAAHRGLRGVQLPAAAALRSLRNKRSLCL